MIAVPRVESNRRSDSHRIALAAKERLRLSLYSGLQNISCECDEAGVLLLQGQLPSFHQKQMAQEAVFHLDGVTQVVNQIEVVEPLGDQGLMRR
jgi:osmotically-inducible protein OsmY